MADLLYLDLETLGDKHQARGPFATKLFHFRDAAKVRMESHGHEPGCAMPMRGAYMVDSRLLWTRAENDLFLAYQDTNATTKDAAVAITAVALEALTGTFYEREGNARGEGFDFTLWQGTRDETDSLSPEDRLLLRYSRRVAYLEVTGVSSQTQNAVRRMRDKVMKFRTRTFKLPLWIIVVDFQEPSFLMEVS